MFMGDFLQLLVVFEYVKRQGCFENIQGLETISYVIVWGEKHECSYCPSSQSVLRTHKNRRSKHECILEDSTSSFAWFAGHL